MAPPLIRAEPVHEVLDVTRVDGVDVRLGSFSFAGVDSSVSALVSRVLVDTVILFKVRK